MIPAVFVVAVVVATFVVGAWSVQLARTTSDVYVASRSVPPLWNASAISGEYLSAASFLGVAGLVMKFGADALWYPVGYAAGYLVLLLFVAAPLRRSGAYTIPDFAEARLGSPSVRRAATGVVLLICWFYLLPQLQGAGLTFRFLFDTPEWVGVVVVGVVVTLNVTLGGMRGITFVQGFQYWVKLTAIAIPAVVLVMVWRGDGAPDPSAAEVPRTREPVTLEVPETVRIRVNEPAAVTATGTVDGSPVDGDLVLSVGEHTIEQGAVLGLPAGTVVPHRVGLDSLSGVDWVRPGGSAGGTRDHPLFGTYSLLIATFLGTMGLPHILVRFSTNPDGGAARRTTVLVLAMMGAFYVFPAIHGALGRVYAADLYATGRTDTVVLVLPERLVDGLAGQLLAGVVAAGAVAAFLSTASGLLVSLAGALAHDVFRGGIRQFRLGSILAGGVAIAGGLLVGRFDIGVLVAWAFTIAASSFCPLLVLGIWWRGLTAPGAVAGLLTGALTSSAAIAATMARLVDGGWPEALLAQPALWSVPLAFTVMVGVSRVTAAGVPPDVDWRFAALHLPERSASRRGQAAGRP